jgi:glycogen debranching enzyme
VLAACAGTALLALAAPTALRAQAVPKFEIRESPIQLDGPARPGVYLGGVGRRAAFFGEETGSFEAWGWPVKLLHDFQLAFKIPDYSEPIPGSTVAKRVIVRPELMTVVYSHATFTVEQHFLVPLDEPGIVILLDIDAAKPLEIEASFRTDLDLMWPAGIGGQYAYYDDAERRFVLSESRREYNAFVGSPFATAGSTHPAHATPDAPSVFRIAVDAARTRAEFLPIVIAGGIMPRDSLAALYTRLLAGAEARYRERVAHADSIREALVSVETGDPELDLALEWAKVNLDEALVCNPDLGCGLVAGYGPSGRGRRPGFGWFFGGDASINSLGILPTGAFELVRAGLDFQRRYRRADGKMPHEVTQSALRTRVDWFQEFPYPYYHADTTPYWVVALWQYWLQSADTAFVRGSWDAVRDAYAWGLKNDSDGDLIVDNTAAGLGAVEVGAIGEGLHQDIYLAGVWVESLRATADLAAALGDTALAQEAGRNFERARTNLEREYYIRDAGLYAFGVLAGGKTNPAVTMWPATAMSFSLLDYARAQKHADALASHRLLSDWGSRMLDSDHPLFDPLEYNMGTVWGFLTGFASWGLYNYGHPHGGFAALWSVAQSTFYTALGRNPELQSGAFRRTLDTTVPHQFFATSMIPAPLFRGLLGLAADAPRGALSFAPNLPAHWSLPVSVRRYPVGADRLDLTLVTPFRYTEGEDRLLEATLEATFKRAGAGPPIALRFAPALPPGSRVLAVRVDGVPVAFEQVGDATATRPSVTVTVRDETRVSISYEPGIAVVPQRPKPAEGATSSALRIISYGYDDARGEYVLRVEGRGQRDYEIKLVSPRGAPRSVRGAELQEVASFRPPLAAKHYRLRLAIAGDPDRYHAREIRFVGPGDAARN